MSVNNLMLLFLYNIFYLNKYNGMDFSLMLIISVSILVALCFKTINKIYSIILSWKIDNCGNRLLLSKHMHTQREKFKNNKKNTICCVKVCSTGFMKVISRFYRKVPNCVIFCRDSKKSMYIVTVQVKHGQQYKITL